MASGKGAAGFVKTLQTLLEELDRPVRGGAVAGKKKRAGPGRPAKVRAQTMAVILHLYKDQVRWLDDYARWVESLAAGNARLSRVEIVRGLLLGLAEFTVKSGAIIAEGTAIRSERDLQGAVAAALECGGRRMDGKKEM